MSDCALVSFVGAGPGDPDLITVKGQRRLCAADVVIHDRLVSSELLQMARPDAEVIDVGKAPGGHGIGQGQINALLVDWATRRRLVVRLKGGDPGIFGRLGEEIQAVRAAGLPFEVVPGVTTGCAAAARAGISLTERGAASMVVLATGTDHTGGLAALDWDLLARSEGTLVFYMPVRSLGAVTSTLMARGRDPWEPAVVVERAATVGEQVVAGRLGTIAAVTREARIEAPAILITGPTVPAPSLPLAEGRALVGPEGARPAPRGAGRFRAAPTRSAAGGAVRYPRSRWRSMVSAWVSRLNMWDTAPTPVSTPLTSGTTKQQKTRCSALYARGFCGTNQLSYLVLLGCDSVIVTGS